jgi:hypothetical protein
MVILKMTKLSWFKLSFAFIGALGGFLYWKFVGCLSGTCPIKSVWYYSTLWGLAFGYLIGDLIGSFFIKKEIRND